VWNEVAEALMDVAQIPTLHVTPGLARPLPHDPGHPSVRVMAHGSMEVRWFRPQPDSQHEPHDRDEVYFVVAGAATFCRGNEAGAFTEDHLALLGDQRVAVTPGDVLFVPAGAAHTFTHMTADFAVWAVFYGPEGGEAP